MNAVFISATQDVVLGDGDAVDAAARGLQIAHTLQAIQIPHLHRGQRQAVIQAFPQLLLLLYMHRGFSHTDASLFPLLSKLPGKIYKSTFVVIRQLWSKASPRHLPSHQISMPTDTMESSFTQTPPFTSDLNTH